MALYQFQGVGAEWLAGKRRAYLADPMGMGKSVQVATAARLLRKENTLVIAPATALDNWKREWERWGHGRITTVSWASPQLQQIDGSQFDLVIPDEAHKAMNPRAIRTARVLDIARRAGAAWPLSGTPMPKHPGQLFPVVRVLWPELVPLAGGRPMTYDQWFNHFCFWRLTRYGKRAYAIRNREQLSAILKQIMLRRKWSEVDVQMPPLRVHVSLLPRTAEFAGALEQALGGRIDVDGLVTRMEAEEEQPCPRCKDHTVEEQERCTECGGEGVVRGSESRLRRLLGAYKTPLICQQLAEELEAGAYDKIVVVGYHRATLALIRDALGKFGMTGIDGSVPVKRRQERIDLFTRDPACRVFYLQQTAGGEAINLQVAREIALLEPSWTADENAQIIKRVHRIGSTEPVRARIFAVADTLDEAVQQANATNIRMQHQVGL